MTSQEMKAAVEAEPCRCERCPACHGSGTIRASMDDFDEPEECYACGGTGIEFVCDRCDYLEALDQEEHT